MTNPQPFSQKKLEEFNKEKVEIIQRLRAPSNWLRQPRGEEWKDAINVYDRTPFEAADLLIKMDSILLHTIEEARREERAELKKKILAMMIPVPMGEEYMYNKAYNDGLDMIEDLLEESKEGVQDEEVNSLEV